MTDALEALGGLDALDAVGDAAEDLLARAWWALDVAGAPVDHPAWPLLRTVGLSPLEAVRAVAALRPTAVREGRAALMPLVDGYRAAASAVSEAAGAAPLPESAGAADRITGGGAAGWTGTAATAYAGRAAALAAWVTGGGPGPAGGVLERARDTVAYADALADWIVDTRLALAGTLATALTSRQAVTLRAVDPSSAGAGVPVGPLPVDPSSAGAGVPVGPLSAGVGVAAADVTARVLGTVAEAYARAAGLLVDASPPPARPLPTA